MKTVQEQNDAGIILFISLVVAMMLVLVFLIGESHACTDQEAVQCLLGEARGEGMNGMIAIGEALRNRGTTQGVYGCRAKFNEPEWVWAMGRKAWEASKTSNLTNRADHWGSIKVDGKWIAKMDKTMVFTTQIGNHKFYRRK